jgi:hypothetical protein
MTVTQKISQLIMNEIANGMDPVEAFRLVAGTEIVDQMISDLYDELRAA